MEINNSYSNPLITAIIPTFRRPRMVARAIRSVLNQTFTRLRVFVTDDASGDETAGVIRSIQESDSRVIYHCHPVNIGMNGNFAFGMAHVETPFYSLLSDDDVLLPEFYETAYSEFQKYPKAIFVATKVPRVTDDGRFYDEPLSLWDRFGLFEPPTGAYRVAAIVHPTITGILFRREFLETSYAHLDPHIYANDYEITFNAALNYPIVTVDRPGALFVCHGMIRAKPMDPFSKVEYYLSLIQRVDQDDRFPDVVKDSSRKKFKTYLSDYLSNIAISSILKADNPTTEKAISIMEEAIECKDLVRKIKLINRLFKLIPLPVRRHLQPILKPIQVLRNYQRQRKLPYIETAMRSCLRYD